jgi:hypothetical protein
MRLARAFRPRLSMQQMDFELLFQTRSSGTPDVKSGLQFHSGSIRAFACRQCLEKSIQFQFHSGSIRAPYNKVISRFSRIKGNGNS